MIFQHDEEFNSSSQRRRIRINLNGEFEGGKELHLESDWNFPEFLNACSQRLGASSLKRVFTVDGNDIDDCMMIEDNDILFLSNGDDFIPPLADRRNGLSWDSTIPSSLSGFKVGSMLGRGGFGEVRVGEHHLTGERVALKFLRKSEIISMGAAERTTTEIQCLSALKHTNIIKMQQHLESPHYVVLVFELMEGGDLSKFLLQRQKEAIAEGAMLSAFHYALPEDEARHVFGQLVSAVGYAHNQHICHRDLKLENILLKEANLSCVKIADFGLSAFYRPGAMMKSSCGTLSFLAPEVFAGTSNAGPPLDVWALGVILFAMLCGRLPFEGPDLAGTKRPRDSVIRSRIMKGQYKIEEGLSPEAKDLVRRMLRVDPPFRASVPEIFAHVWTRSSTSVPYDATTASTMREQAVTPTPLDSSSTETGDAIASKDNLCSNDSSDNKSFLAGNLTGPSSGETDFDPEDVLSIDMSKVIDRLQAASPFGDQEDGTGKIAGYTTPDRESPFHNDSSHNGPKDSPRVFLGDVSKHNEETGGNTPPSDSKPKSPDPFNSVVLMPLRRNAAPSARDVIPSPRRPRTAAVDEDLLSSTKPRSDSLDLLYTERDGSCKTSSDAGDDTFSSRSSSGRSSIPSGRRTENNSPAAATAGRKQTRPLVRKSSSWTERMEMEFSLVDKPDGADNNPSNSVHRCSSSEKRGGDGASSSVYNSPSHREGRKSALHFAGTSSLKSSYGGGNDSSPSSTKSRGNSWYDNNSPGGSDGRVHSGGSSSGGSRMASRHTSQKPHGDSSAPYSNYDSHASTSSRRGQSSIHEKNTRKSNGMTKGSDI